MANEIQYRHQETGLDLYAVLFDAIGRVWNVLIETWETLVVAEWDDYATVLTESPAGSYRYQTSMPDVAAGVYAVQVYESASGAFEVTDALVGIGRMDWSGTAEIVPASASVCTEDRLARLDATVGSRAVPGDVTAAHATTNGKIDAVAAQVDVKTSTREAAGAAAAAAEAIRGGERTLADLATPEDVRTTVLPGTLQVRAGTFTLQGASQQLLDLPAGYASTLALRLVDADEEPVDLSEADLVLRAVDKDGEELFVLTEGDGITKTDAEDGQFTIAISAEQAVMGRHKYELGDSGSETLYAKGDLVFRETFGLEAEA